MPWFDIIWDDGPGGYVIHLAEHGVMPDEAEEVPMHPAKVERSRSSGRCIAFGRTREGRNLAVVYEQVDRVTVLPVTAFDLEA
ncbi:MAG: hypothetical protein ACP5O7_10460 [Phycisphaerae bacterium]